MVTQASKNSVEPHLCSEAQHAQPTGGGAKAPQPSGGLLPKGKSAFASQLLPRILRFRDAPAYLGMDRNRFNAEVRPFLTEIPIGRQGVGFDRLELDAWLEDYIARNGRPARKGAQHMGRKHFSGLVLRGGIWHIDKRICGRRICQSTEAAELVEAEKYLARVMEQTRQAQIYGVRPKRTFEQAAAKFVLEHEHKRSLRDDVGRLKNLMPWIGGLTLDPFTWGRYNPGSSTGAGKACPISPSITVCSSFVVSPTWRQASGWTSTV